MQDIMHTCYVNMIMQMSYVLLCRIVLTHFELQSHADILRNELVQFICRTSVQSVDVDAKGGVVAGVISVSNAEFGCK